MPQLTPWNNFKRCNELKSTTQMKDVSQL